MFKTTYDSCMYSKQNMDTYISTEFNTALACI